MADSCLAQVSVLTSLVFCVVFVALCIHVEASDPPKPGGIPLILHQKWKNAPIPDRLLPAYRKCQYHARNATGFKHWLWTDEQVFDFIKKDYPWFVDTFVNYKYDIQRYDAGRYFMLYHFGGLYLDLDLQCNVDLKSFLGEFSNRSDQVIVSQAYPFGVAIDIIATPPRHPFYHQLIHNLEGTANRWCLLPYLTTMTSAGTLFFTFNVWSYPHQEHFQYLHDPKYRADYFLNLHFHSWHQWDGSIIWFIYQSKYYLIFLCVLTLILLVVRRKVTNFRFRTLLRKPYDAFRQHKLV